jgi:hypothetical protein
MTTTDIRDRLIALITEADTAGVGLVIADGVMDVRLRRGHVAKEDVLAGDSDVRVDLTVDVSEDLRHPIDDVCDLTLRQVVDLSQDLHALHDESEPVSHSLLASVETLKGSLANLLDAISDMKRRQNASV